VTPASNDGEAGELFQANRDRIYRYVLGMVRNGAEAEDLTQETILRAYRRRDSLRDPNAVRGWLYRIATRVCLDRMRQRVQNVSIEDAETTPCESPSAQELTERAETSACVQRCLDYLPDSYRAVILLYEAHSLTALEIAGLLSVSVGAVKIRLHRVHHRLQEIMEIGCAVSQSTRGVPCCEERGVTTNPR